MLVQRPVSLAVLLNILHVAIVQRGEVGPGFSVRTKEFIKLSVEGLGIAMFGSVNEQRHQPRRQGCDGRPTESLWRKTNHARAYAATIAKAAGCVVNPPTRVRAWRIA